MTILVPKTELGLVGWLPAGDFLVRKCGARLIVGMDEPLPGTHVGFDLVVRVAEHLLPARRIHDGIGFKVPVPHTFLGACECQPKPFFALTQSLFGPFTLGDIKVRPNNTDDGAVGSAADRKPARQDSDVMAVLVTQPELALVRQLILHHTGVQCVGDFLILGMQQSLPRAEMRFDLVVRIAEHFLPAGRIDHVTGFDVPVPDTFPSTCECEAKAFLAFAQRRVGRRRLLVRGHQSESKSSSDHSNAAQ